ncbi:unnamed protein product [Ceratitis capitata]|uniref:(Mediterranean fruit fly) hypothetical protein n=1 Tax=Ceratitis capitata TaxID=7213 RepID=A0A811UB82_CERCA|nr:unnamed protein product [Ceratitis capitata]
MTTMTQHHQQATALHPTTAMHMSAAAAAAAAAAAGLPPGAAATGPPGQAAASAHTAHHHFLSSPALASPVGSSNNPTHPSNPPLAANAPCSTLFVANLGQFVSEHELKEVFSRLFPLSTNLSEHVYK